MIETLKKIICELKHTFQVEISYVDVWKEGSAGRRNRKCKGPKVGMNLECSVGYK